MGNQELSLVGQASMGGGGPAESCCAELLDTACPALSCHCPCPSKEDAEGPLLYPHSCRVPSLCLCAIAPRHLLLMGMELQGERPAPLVGGVFLRQS